MRPYIRWFIVALGLAGVSLAHAWQRQLDEPLACPDLTIDTDPWIQYAELPRAWIVAIVAVEDPGFWTHGGYDLQRIAKAIRANAVVGAQGGSTLTQQIASRLFRRPGHGPRLDRLLDPVRLEARYSKQQLLEIYSNEISLGGGDHGIAAAARRDFGLEVGELGLVECAFLAGLPQNPSHYRNSDRAEVRTRYVLERIAATADSDLGAEAARLLDQGFVLPFECADPR